MADVPTTAVKMAGLAMTPDGALYVTGISSGLTIGTTTITGGATTQVLFNLSGVVSSSANMTYSDTLVNGGPGLIIGSGTGTSCGWKIGYGSSSGYSGIYPGTVTPSASNYTLLAVGGNTYLNGETNLRFDVAHVAKMEFINTAGRGPDITAGIAATDVAALSVIRTNNNAAVATGVKFAFIDTTSAATFEAFGVYGGASATTKLISIVKDGATTLGNLAGTGSRAVLADANGLLSAPVSDADWKENVAPIPYGLPEIRRVAPKIFNFKNRNRFGNSKYLGVIAQEVEEIMPELVGRDIKGTRYVNYEQFAAVLINAVAQLDARIPS